MYTEAYTSGPPTPQFNGKEWSMEVVKAKVAIDLADYMQKTHGHKRHLRRQTHLALRHQRINYTDVSHLV